MKVSFLEECYEDSSVPEMGWSKARNLRPRIAPKPEWAKGLTEENFYVSVIELPKA